jgi:preprotein translocase subunit YajC
MSFFISSAMAQTAEGAAAPGSAVSSLIFFAGFALIFYFIIWRPQSKRAKEHKNLLEGIQKGDEVMTTGGLLGKVKKISGDYMVLQVADNVQLKVQKASVMAALPKDTIKSIDDATE